MNLPPGDMNFEHFNLPKLQPPIIHPAPDTPLGLQLKVVLNHTQPEIWRRIVVPGDLTLDIFHLVLQGAMGWENYHLHHFSQGPEYHPFITEFFMEEQGFGYVENEFRIDQLLTKVGDQLTYDYDFGDNWEHTIVVEEVLDTVPEQPRCIGGARACPPEDMGGLPMLALVLPWAESGYKNEFAPEHLDADHYRQWLEDWDPAVFDLVAATHALQALVHKDPNRISGQLHRLFSEIPPTRGALLMELLDQDVWYNPVVSSSPLTVENLQPLLQLLTLLEGGVKLTPSKYLPVAVVRDYVEKCGLSTWWPRKVTSESVTPVLEIREAMRSLGLLRVIKGVIATTKKAHTLGADPLAWEKHLREKLPLGKTDFERHAGWVALAVIGSGAPVSQWKNLISAVLTDMGWEHQDQEGNRYPPGYHSPTFVVLNSLAADMSTPDWELETVSEARVSAVVTLARSLVVVAQGD